MSLIAPGNYFIVNSVPSVIDGFTLAITFNGVNSALTVTPLDKSQSSQVWNINKYDGYQQTVSPKDNPSVQVALGDDYLITLPAKAYTYTWVIRQNDADGTCTFQTADLTVYWDLEQASADQPVTYDSQSGDPTQKWWLFHPDQ